MYDKFKISRFISCLLNVSVLFFMCRSSERLCERNMKKFTFLEKFFKQ